ncbi:polymer-forming cytoskeletal protein [Lysobacter sp. Hz 25]|uniref:polymer-forming cytoskeletal protein n=1 Tax=Lysobacter sp. Hz 25 TaxID=3383698 RepID=UPI0038D3F988
MSSPARELIERLPLIGEGAAATQARELLAMDVDWASIRGQASSAAAWRPSQAFLIVEGSLDLAGNAVIGTGEHDHGALIVLGDLRCRNLVVAQDFHLVVTGDLIASEAVVADLRDSTAHVAGAVQAPVLLSGDAGWLTLDRADGLRVARTSAYVIVDEQPLPLPPHSLSELVDDGVLDREEWDGLDADEREGQDIDEFVVLDEDRVLRRLAAGDSILRG